MTFSILQEKKKRAVLLPALHAMKQITLAMAHNVAQLAVAMIPTALLLQPVHIVDFSLLTLE